jgi:ABC-type polar amino acid transport system ATPase subunit
LETVVKQSELDSMSIDELLMLHQRITATLDAKITAEKEALVDRLKQADMTMH